MPYSLAASVALKSIAVLGAAWLLAFFMRKASAGVRHMVWTTACLALLALPFLSISVPAVPVPMPGVLVNDFQTTSSASPTPSTSNTQARSDNAVPTPSAIRIDWPLLLVGLWGVGATLGLVQMLAAWLSIHRIQRSARPLGKVVGDIEILETPAGTMPMISGLLRPKVMLPADAAGWPQERRRIVLLHELAHIRRADIPMHLLARIAVTCYWWNPLAWIAWREFLNERERATDDLVLSAGTRASDYAGHLVEVARSMRQNHAISTAAVAMAHHSPLEGRVRAILDANRNRRAPGLASAVAAALLAVAILIPLSAVRAQDKQPVPTDIAQTIRTAKAERNPARLENAAAAARKLFLYDEAREALLAALALRAELSGASDPSYASVLIQLGALEQTQGRMPRAEEYYNKAIAILGNRPEASPAWLNLGVASLVRKDYEQAIERFQRVAEPAKAARAKMWIAVARQRQNRVDEAEALYKSALAMQEPDSPDAAVTMELYAMMLRSQKGREEDAESWKQRAAATRKLPLAPQAAGPGVYRIGGGVTAPRLKSKVEPKYSEEARVAMLSGTCVAQVEIGPDGQPHNLRVLRGLGLGLDEKALEAISQWRFEPGTRNGDPVTVMATIEVNFRLL